MGLTKQEYLDLITNIGTCEDEVQRRDMLASLSSEASELYDNNEQHLVDIGQLTADNETLRAANMNLFLKVGANKSEAERIKDTTGINQEPAEKRKFEDLFDEKGGIK